MAPDCARCELQANFDLSRASQERDELESKLREYEVTVLIASGLGERA